MSSTVGAGRRGTEAATQPGSACRLSAQCTEPAELPGRQGSAGPFVLFLTSSCALELVDLTHCAVPFCCERTLTAVACSLCRCVSEPVYNTCRNYLNTVSCCRDRLARSSPAREFLKIGHARSELWEVHVLDGSFEKTSDVLRSWSPVDPCRALEGRKLGDRSRLPCRGRRADCTELRGVCLSRECRCGGRGTASVVVCCL